MKIPPVEAELFHAYGRTDMTKLIWFFAIRRRHLKRQQPYRKLHTKYEFQNLNKRDHLEDLSIDEGIILIMVFMTGSEIVDCVRSLPYLQEHRQALSCARRVYAKCIIHFTFI